MINYVVLGLEVVKKPRNVGHKKKNNYIIECIHYPHTKDGHEYGGMPFIVRTNKFLPEFYNMEIGTRFLVKGAFKYYRNEELNRESFSITAEEIHIGEEYNVKYDNFQNWR